MPVADLLRKVGVSKATFFKWRSKYGGASSDVKRLRELEVENAKLKRMYADLALENAAIKESSTESCKAVGEATDCRDVGGGTPPARPTGLSRVEAVASGVLPASVSASRRDASVIATLTDVVARYPRWGFWNLFDRLRVEASSSLSAKSPLRAQCPPVIGGALTVCAGAPRVSSAP